jgi:hypothetical protein
MQKVKIYKEDNTKSLNTKFRLKKMNSTFFPFENIFEEFVYPITPNLILRIKRRSISIASLYFTNAENQRIEIPAEISIFAYERPLGEIIQKPFDQEYFLCGTDNYEIVFNEEPILDIKRQTMWSITPM